LAAVVQRFGFAPSDKPVLHCAPERCLVPLMQESFGNRYHAADYDPSRYAFPDCPVHEIDLSRMPEFFGVNSLAGIVHAHVLEHIPGPIDKTIGEINAAIEPGGFHLFSAPVAGGWFREDADPDMPPAERQRLFFQEDHLRVFGRQDFESRVLRLFEGFDQIDILDHVGRDDLTEIAVARSVFSYHNGHRPYLFIKPSGLPAAA
jgi:phosphoglycolate phosphatase